jgi:DNA-binding transcriptional MerR regulator
MNGQLLTIGTAAKLLGVSIQTLRRWDATGKLSPPGRQVAKHRRYSKSDIENYARDNLAELDLFKIARNWAADPFGEEPIPDFYCSDSSIFRARLSRLERELGRIEKFEKILSLITAVVAEIGDNSFDHNLGNWPDIGGIFFAWDLGKGKIALADRGQGILATLRKVRPELKSHQDALLVAFTEIISGRAPEYRGNGLKFVKEVVTANKMDLFFQSGDAWLRISKRNPDINIQKSDRNFSGCLALIKI